MTDGGCGCERHLGGIMRRGAFEESLSYILAVGRRLARVLSLVLSIRSCVRLDQR